MEGRLFTLDAQFLFDVIVLALSMFLLFGLLSYLLFNPVRDLLKKRKQRVVDECETAKKEKAEAIAYKEQYDKRLGEAGKAAEGILSEARRKALKNETKIITEAREEAAKMIVRANAEIEQNKKRALDEMKQEIITIASMMARKVVAASIDLDEQDRLIEDTLKEMSEGTWEN